MTLQEIKDQVAKEWNSTINDFIERDQRITMSQIIDEIAKRYATECVKASLEMASESALVNIELKRGSESITVHKSSITNPENIILL